MNSKKYILVLNIGSSSFKFKFFTPNLENIICEGSVERIGIGGGFYGISFFDKKIKEKKEFANQLEAMNFVLLFLKENSIIDDFEQIEFIGHRIVHGGEKFTKPCFIGQEEIVELEKISDLAPLHNPFNIEGIKYSIEFFKKAKNIGVFDTAFHSTLEKKVFLYAIPYELYETKGIRKYGFHGTSHQYVSEFISAKLGKNDLKIISCHLGNGQSVCAIDSGKSKDISMGFTPLDGVIMGTRSGTIDPGVILFLGEKGYSIKEIDEILNKKSGVLGIYGKSSDVRDIRENKDTQEMAKLTYDMMVYRLCQYISSYIGSIGGVDVISFTGGIGENYPGFRKSILDSLKYFGVEIDEGENEKSSLEITKKSSKIKAFVIKANEEYQIAKEVLKLIS